MINTDDWRSVADGLAYCRHAGDCGVPACPYFRREGAQCFQTLMQDAEAMIRAMASRIEQLERTTEK